jgi:hypothetical protein
MRRGTAESWSYNIHCLTRDIGAMGLIRHNALSPISQQFAILLYLSRGEGGSNDCYFVLGLRCYWLALHGRCLWQYFPPRGKEAYNAKGVLP